jgi:hypothetical protein
MVYSAAHQELQHFLPITTQLVVVDKINRDSSTKAIAHSRNINGVRVKLDLSLYAYV